MVLAFGSAALNGDERCYMLTSADVGRYSRINRSANTQVEDDLLRPALWVGGRVAVRLGDVTEKAWES